MTEESIPEKRYMTVHDRFQVGDECCGIVETAMTLNDALLIAKNEAKRHARDPLDTITHVSVFDVMARKNRTNEWRVPVDRTAKPSTGTNASTTSR